MLKSIGVGARSCGVLEKKLPFFKKKHFKLVAEKGSS